MLGSSPRLLSRQFAAAVRIPNAPRARVRCQPLAIRRKRHLLYNAIMRQLEELFAGAAVPDLDQLVVGAGCDLASVRRHCDSSYRPVAGNKGTLVFVRESVFQSKAGLLYERPVRRGEVGWKRGESQ